MYGFLLRPKWIGFHLLVLAGIIVMINLGFWQLRRLDARQDFNALVEGRIDQPVRPLDDVLAIGAPSDIDWFAVAVEATYLPDEQFLVVNRSQNGQAGVNVVTPAKLDDGRILVVNRGFVPQALDVPAVPATAVTLTGRVHPSQQRRLGQLSDAAAGDLAEAQRIDLERLAPQLPGEVIPVYLDLIESVPDEQPGLPEPVVRPDLSEGNHLSYAVQWFLFSVAVAIGWWLAIRRSIGKRNVSTVDHPGNGTPAPVSDY